MSHLDRSNDLVRNHLRDNGFPGKPNGLVIESAPGDNAVITLVRIADRTRVWSADYADHLAWVLGRMPGHPRVLRSAVRDAVTVTWDGI